MRRIRNILNVLEAVSFLTLLLAYFVGEKTLFFHLPVWVITLTGNHLPKRRVNNSNTAMHCILVYFHSLIGLTFFFISKRPTLVTILMIMNITWLLILCFNDRVWVELLLATKVLLINKAESRRQYYLNEGIYWCDPFKNDIVNVEGKIVFLNKEDAPPWLTFKDCELSAKRSLDVSHSYDGSWVSVYFKGEVIEKFKLDKKHVSDFEKFITTYNTESFCGALCSFEQGLLINKCHRLRVEEHFEKRHSMELVKILNKRTFSADHCITLDAVDYGAFYNFCPKILENINIFFYHNMCMFKTLNKDIFFDTLIDKLKKYNHKSTTSSLSKRYVRHINFMVCKLGSRFNDSQWPKWAKEHTAKDVSRVCDFFNDVENINQSMGTLYVKKGNNFDYVRNFDPGEKRDEAVNVKQGLVTFMSPFFKIKMRKKVLDDARDEVKTFIEKCEAIKAKNESLEHKDLPPDLLSAKEVSATPGYECRLKKPMSFINALKSNRDSNKLIEQVEKELIVAQRNFDKGKDFTGNEEYHSVVKKMNELNAMMKDAEDRIKALELRTCLNPDFGKMKNSKRLKERERVRTQEALIEPQVEAIKSEKLRMSSELRVLSTRKMIMEMDEELETKLLEARKKFVKVKERGPVGDYSRKMIKKKLLCSGNIKNKQNFDIKLRNRFDALYECLETTDGKDILSKYVEDVYMAKTMIKVDIDDDDTMGFSKKQKNESRKRMASEIKKKKKLSEKGKPKMGSAFKGCGNILFERELDAFQSYNTYKRSIEASMVWSVHDDNRESRRFKMGRKKNIRTAINFNYYLFDDFINKPKFKILNRSENSKSANMDYCIYKKAISLIDNMVSKAFKG